MESNHSSEEELEEIIRAEQNQQNRVCHLTIDTELKMNLKG